MKERRLPLRNHREKEDEKETARKILTRSHSYVTSHSRTRTFNTGASHSGTGGLIDEEGTERLSLRIQSRHPDGYRGILNPASMRDRHAIESSAAEEALKKKATGSRA